MEEPSRLDEPQAAQEYAGVLTQVVASGRPVIVRSDLYPRRGQPSLPRWKLALVTVMQFAEDLSDRQDQISEVGEGMGES